MHKLIDCVVGCRRCVMFGMNITTNIRAYLCRVTLSVCSVSTDIKQCCSGCFVRRVKQHYSRWIQSASESREVRMGLVCPWCSGAWTSMLSLTQGSSCPRCWLGDLQRELGWERMIASSASTTCHPGLWRTRSPSSEMLVNMSRWRCSEIIRILVAEARQEVVSHNITTPAWIILILTTLRLKTGILKCKLWGGGRSRTLDMVICQHWEILKYFSKCRSSIKLSEPRILSEVCNWYLTLLIESMHDMLIIF